MKKLLSTWCLLAMTVGTMMVMTGCSVGDDADSTDLPTAQPDNEAIVAESIYEGVWTVNKQVVDTARLVVSETMQVRLPERYLLSLCSFVSAEPCNTPTLIRLWTQGYSKQSQYHSFSASNTETADGQMIFNTCAFYANINGTMCRISLLSKDINANAVLQNATGQWTLVIPISAFLVRDLTTGESNMWELPNTITIYYNTKQRIG